MSTRSLKFASAGSLEGQVPILSNTQQTELRIRQAQFFSIILAFLLGVWSCSVDLKGFLHLYPLRQLLSQVTAK